MNREEMDKLMEEYQYYTLKSINRLIVGAVTTLTLVIISVGLFVLNEPGWGAFFFFVSFGYFYSLANPTYRNPRTGEEIVK